MNDLSNHSVDTTTAGDVAVQHLFDEWRRQLAIADTDGTPESEVDRLVEIERQIFDTPCGEVGEAIQLYLLAQNTLCEGRGGKLYAATEPGIDAYSTDGRLRLDYHGFRSLLSQAARRVPELAPLVADIVSSPLILPQLLH